MTDKQTPREEEIHVSDADLENKGLEGEVDGEAKSRVGQMSSRRRSVYAGMWGPLEIVVVAAASFLLLLAALFYLLMVVPAQSELSSGQRQRDELDKDLREAREKWGDIRTTETQVAKLLTSAEDFESRALKDGSIGTTAIYQRINVLINAYGLRNTSGPDYVPLEIPGTTKTGRQSSSGKRGRDKFKSIFPGIYITTTVEGSYVDLRRFIRDIESSSEFVAITSVELEPSDEEEKQAETQTVDVTDDTGRVTAQRYRKGRYRGNTVSLRIEMAAYFRRPADQRLNNAAPENESAQDADIPGVSD